MMGDLNETRSLEHLSHSRTHKPLEEDPSHEVVQQPPPPPPLQCHSMHDNTAASILNFHSQPQNNVVHNFEEFTTDLFAESQQQHQQDDWENNAATQIVTRLGHDMKFVSRREYDIARAAAMRMADLYKDRIAQVQQNNQMNQMVNNNVYRRDVNFNLMIDPLQMMQAQGPNLPHVPQTSLDGLKPEGSSKRKLTLQLENNSSHSTTTGNKKARSSTASRWTKEQDDALRAAVNKFEGRNWKAIAELVPGRDHVQCLQRWKKVLRPGLVKGHWSTAEDALLLQLIQDDKMHSWAMVASKIAGRTAKQCRERWSLNLDPSINRSPWTPEEDQLLMKLYDKMGGKWSEIKTEFNGRTENAVKTRYKSLIRAKAREWTQEQDAKLIELRMKYGKNWAAIKNELPGRSRNAIKVRCKTLEYDNNTASNPTL